MSFHREKPILEYLMNVFPTETYGEAGVLQGIKKQGREKENRDKAVTTVGRWNKVNGQNGFVLAVSVCPRAPL